MKVTPCENTAAAAAAVAQSDRTDVAAISSHRCIELYGLERLAADIRTGATTTPGSSASPRSWRSTWGGQDLPHGGPAPTGPAPCTRSWPGSMPWA